MKRNLAPYKIELAPYKIELVGYKSETREYFNLNEAVQATCKFMDVYDDVKTANVFELWSNEYVKIVRDNNGDYILL